MNIIIIALSLFIIAVLVFILALREVDFTIVDDEVDTEDFDW